MLYFKGLWQNDQKNGEGILTKIDGENVQGIWKDNILITQLVEEKN